MSAVELEVRLFAMLRERAGSDRITVAVPEGATVADALDAVARRPGLEELLRALPVVTALDREYVGSDAVIPAGSELAIVPPISGGQGAPVRVFVGERAPSVEALARAVTRPGAGAVVVFCGVTRDVDRLEYEAYVEMARERIEAVLFECVARHGLEAAAAEHRVGGVELGEPSVVVAVSAPHRGEAFAGAREAIDRIKAEAPIWKREVELVAAGERREWVEGTIPAVPALTHLDSGGTARMVDVSGKPETHRVASAAARVRMSSRTAALVARGEAAKGDVLGTARIAAIGAAKRTWDLIPLAHAIPLDHIELEGWVDEAGAVELRSEAATNARTGVEMEAMTACAVGALTVYDMVKGIERGAAIERIELLSKSGGRSGPWEAR